MSLLQIADFFFNLAIYLAFFFAGYYAGGKRAKERELKESPQF